MAIFNFQILPVRPKEDLRQTSKIIETPHDKYFNKLLEEFPKLKIESLSEDEIWDYVEKFIQVHSLRCKRCLEEKRCFKVELLVNIVEIL